MDCGCTGGYFPCNRCSRIAEELWHLLNHENSICDAEFPVYNEQCLIEDCFSYPVSFNGKFRFQLELPITLSPQEVEAEVLACEKSQKYLDGKTPKKVIVVPKRIVNVVI